MFFSTEDYRKIERWLLSNSIKDTQLPEGTTPLSGDEIIAIVQDGKNRKISVSTLLEQVMLLQKLDFINITERFSIGPSPLLEAVLAIPEEKRQLGQVVSFLNEENQWGLFQFIGETLNLWEDAESWKLLVDDSETIIPQLNLTLADEEDLTTEVVSETDKLITYKIKLKDKNYSEAAYSGYGRVWLRKNIVTDPGDPEGETGNFLTQEMFSQPYTIYYVQYNFSIPTGVDIMLPEGAVLFFLGGIIMGPGTLSFSGNNLLDGTQIMIGAHIGSNTGVLSGEPGLMNSEIHTSWFDSLSASDINLLTSGYNTIIVDSNFTIKSPITIYGGIDYTENYKIKVGTSNTWVVPEDEQYPDSIIIFSQDSSTNPNSKRRVNLTGTLIPVYNVFRIIHAMSLMHYELYCSARRTTNGSSLVGILIDTDVIDSSGAVGASLNTDVELSGKISCELSTSTTGILDVIKIHSGADGDTVAFPSVNLTLKDFIASSKGGSSIVVLNKNHVSIISTDFQHNSANVTFNNVTISNFQGVLMKGYYDSVNIKNLVVDNLSTTTQYLPLNIFDLDLVELNVEDCKFNFPVFAGSASYPLTPFNLFKLNDAYKVRVRNLDVNIAQQNICTVFNFNDARDFDIEANVTSDNSVTSLDAPAIKLAGNNTYGKFNINANLPGWTLIEGNQSNNVGDVVLNVHGTLGTVWKQATTNGSKSLVIKDSVVTCDHLFNTTGTNNIYIDNNIVYGKTLFTNTGMSSMTISIMNNELFCPEQSSPANPDDIPIYLGNMGVMVQINNNNIIETIGFNLPIIKGNMVIMSTINNNMLYPISGKAIEIGVLQQSSITDNKIQGSVEESITITTGQNSIVQNNRVITNSGSYKDLNSDGTDKSKVTML